MEPPLGSACVTGCASPVREARLRTYPELTHLLRDARWVQECLGRLGAIH